MCKNQLACEPLLSGPHENDKQPAVSSDEPEIHIEQHRTDNISLNKNIRYFQVGFKVGMHFHIEI